MSIFTRYAMDALMKTTHPEVNRKSWVQEIARICAAACPRSIRKAIGALSSWPMNRHGICYKNPIK